MMNLLPFTMKRCAWRPKYAINKADIIKTLAAAGKSPTRCPLPGRTAI
jgi:hypothetical protein